MKQLTKVGGLPVLAASILLATMLGTGDAYALQSLQPPVDSTLNAASQPPDVVSLADSLGGLIHEANVSGNMEMLKDTRNLAGRALTVYPDNPLLIYWSAMTYFREASHLLEARPNRADSLLDRAEKMLEYAIDREAVIPETYALLGSVLGMQISNPIDGMKLGPDASAAIDRALELDPDNPRIWLASGIGTFHTPGLFGGGTEEALRQFERARELFATDDPAPGYPDWGAAEVRAWMGIAYMDQEQLEKARRVFEEALEIEPDYGWIRYVLLPRLEE